MVFLKHENRPGVSKRIGNLEIVVKGGTALKKLGLLLMFIGIILIAIFMLSDIQMSIQFWLTGFIISMLVSCAGIVLLIIDLAKAIKAEKNRKV
jgi:hypothetical protein